MDARIAHVEGDDLRGDLDAITPPVSGKPVSANAYLGGWGIAEALAAGADVVVTGRVTDASVVLGPAAWWHGWGRDDWDALAGAVVAGHVIECGPQATGGNYSFLDEITDRRYPGFPIAEVAADGSSVITKPDDTGGLVSVGTVTAQLLYEIGPPAYLGPDVTTHFDTIHLAQEGEHRVSISGVRGSPPPDTLKVALNDVGGYRNTMTLVITGLDVEAKAAFAEQQLFDILGGSDRFAEVDVRLLRFDRPDAPANDAGDRAPAGHGEGPGPEEGRARVLRRCDAAGAGRVRRASTRRRRRRRSRCSASTGRPRCRARPSPRPSCSRTGSGGRSRTPRRGEQPATPAPPEPSEPSRTAGPTQRLPLGTVCGARSGDKGGNANIGLWTRDDAAHAWLRGFLTPDRVRELLGPETADLDVEVFDLPNLRAVNVLVHGILGDGVASAVRPDPQAKGLGEYLRSRVVDVPEALLAR